MCSHQPMYTVIIQVLIHLNKLKWIKYKASYLKNPISFDLWLFPLSPWWVSDQLKYFGVMKNMNTCLVLALKDTCPVPDTDTWLPASSWATEWCIKAMPSIKVVTVLMLVVMQLQCGHDARPRILVYSAVVNWPLRGRPAASPGQRTRAGQPLTHLGRYSEVEAELEA